MEQTLKHATFNEDTLFGQKLTERQIDELKKGNSINLDNVIKDGENLIGAKIKLNDKSELLITPDYLSLQKAKETFNLSESDVEELKKNGRAVAVGTNDKYLLTYDQEKKVVIPESFTELEVPNRIEGKKLTELERDTLAKGKTIDNFTYNNDLMSVTTSISLNNGSINMSNQQINLTDKGRFENRLLKMHNNLDFKGIENSTKDIKDFTPSPNLTKTILNDSVSSEHKQKSLQALGINNSSTIIQDHQIIQEEKERRNREKEARKQSTKQKLDKSGNTITGLVDKTWNAMRFG